MQLYFVAQILKLQQKSTIRKILNELTETPSHVKYKLVLFQNFFRKI